MFNKILVEETINKFSKLEKRKKSGSFSELLFSDMINYQSINIKMGNVLERTWKKYINTCDGATLLDINKIEGYQIDLLFEYNNVVYYFEIKNNTNLDTEKTKAVFNKINKMKDILTEKYNKRVECFVLSNRYDTHDNINHIKAPLTKDMIFGYNDLLTLFGDNIEKQEWKIMMKEIGSLIIDLVKSK
jgi:hypothetical protein